MKRFLVLVLTSLLASSTIISQSVQEPPELAQATELTNSVAKLFKEDKFDEALPLARRALEIRERLLPRTDPRITMSLGYVGDLYVAKRDYDNAKKTFERLLQLQEEQGGPNDVKLASTLDRLAVLYNRDGKPAKAEELYQRALALREKALGPEDIQVAETYYALGQFYRIRKDFDKALKSYRRSLAIFVRNSGNTADGFERASTGFSCVGYESGNKAIFDELEAIQKQFAPAQPRPRVDKILNASAVMLAKPEYPARAREQHLSGTIVVQVEIDEEGKVISAKDLCGGVAYLGEASIKAALKSRFAPTTISGVPVKTRGVLQFNFIASPTIPRILPD
jgi:TonB family protein